jgi:hypothetical protein
MKSLRILGILICLTLVASEPAAAEYLAQSKTFNLQGNSTWSFNDDCTKSLALWPADGAPGSKEWRVISPGQVVPFDTSPAIVGQPSTCQTISSSGEATGSEVTTSVIRVDNNGDGVYETLQWPAQFSTPILAERIEPYRISAYWEYAPGERIVNEYWLYVGNVSGVSVNDAAEFTTSPSVTLKIKPMPGSATMQISNDAGFGKSQTFSAQSTLSWVLPEPIDAKVSKNVYVRFFDRDGGLIGTLSDDIILDSFAPQVSKAAAVSTKLQSLLQLSKSKLAKKFRVSISAVDTISGVKSLQLSTFPSPVKAQTALFNRSVNVTAVPQTKIYLRVQDFAGNWSSWKTVFLPKS